ncbi:MAG: ABC transporter ATP-binding protein [Epulopiscium sp.]|nr:ABC transporter ATP-binding protein [Candidatus Epulonipiscium sp.]
MTLPLKCIDISKKFEKTLALNHINLELKDNKFYGLLGANGAGKTTLLKIIANQLFPSEGVVEIFGQSFEEDESRVKDICYVRESNYYWKDLSVNKLISMAKVSYDKWDHQLEKKLREKFKIKNKTLEKLSKGQEAAVNILIGLCSNAKITLFDEAYVGLDAPSRAYFFQLLRESFEKNPRVIILSTHFIEEIEGLLEEIILINEGNLVVHEEKDKILENAYSIIGKGEEAYKIIKGKNILKEEKMGRFSVIHLFDKITNEEINQLRTAGLDVNTMSLQNWFIHMINNNDEE